MLKRTMAILLALIMLVSAAPLTAFAQDAQTETSVDTGDVNVQGTNGVGDLLSEDLITYQEQTEESAAGGYTIVDLQVEGNTATVEYAVIEQARLVVSIYTEDGLKMLLSGNTLISPEETQATVTLEGTMPQYFMASAYMVDIYDYSPLCDAYSTPMYTKDMQDLLASDIYDYDQDRVLNLDESTETNFAVYAEDTIVIPYEAGVNTVASIDEELGLYVIENANSHFTGLQAGDVFSYAYGDNEYLIARVADIEVDGSTVTILGGDLEVEDVFSHVKMEAEATAADFTVDDSNLEEGITYEGLTGGVQTFAWDGSLEDEVGVSYRFLRSKQSVSGENADIEVKVEGQVRLNIKTKIDYYISLKHQYIQYKTDLTLKIGVTVTGEFTLKVPLGPMGFNLGGCIFIGLTPELQAEFTGAVSIAFTSSCTIGFQYDSGTFTNLCTIPNLSFEADVEGSFFFGVDLNPTISVLNGKAVEVELEVPFGIEITSKLNRSQIIAGQEDQSSRHACDNCREITQKFIANAGIKIKFLNKKRLTFSRTFEVVETPLSISYQSYDFDEKGEGQCPHKEYRISLQILNEQNSRVSNAQLTAVWKDKNETLDLGTTNEKGVWVDYLCPGTYDLTVTADGKTVTHTVKIKEAGRLFLIHAEQSETDKLLGGINPGTIIEGGDQEISGSCGDNVTYELFPNGLLLIEGTGDMQDFNNAAGTPWNDYADQITDVVIADGITSIGAAAFAWYDEDGYLIKYPLHSIVIGNDVETIGAQAFIGVDGLTSIELPGSVKRIEDGAFSGCDDLQTVILSEGLEIIGPDAFEECAALTSVVLPESVTYVGIGAFGWCDSLTELTFPANVCHITGGVTAGSTNVSGLYVSADNPYYTSVDGVLFNKDMTRLESAPGGLTGTYVIPEGVTLIGQAAFDWSQISAVVIPESVQNIDAAAFADSAVENVYFLGDAPASIYINAFDSIVATAYYPADNATWTEDIMLNYGGTITWVPYTLDKNGDPIIESTAAVQVAAEEEEIVEDNGGISTFGIWGGEYETEETPDYDLKTAVFSGLVPSEQYLMVAVASIDTDDLLAADNLLYIAQGEADASGNLRITYVQRVDTDLSYVFACGPSNKNLKDAVITFPTMLATGESQLIEPKVVYGGKTLKEGQDYIIAGIADYTQAGTYTCYIRGIYDYTGTVECKYTVGQLPASGTCGEGLSWSLTEDGILTISGSGTMDDTAPWSYYREFITQVVVEKGVQSISSGAFAGCEKLAKISFQGDAPAISEDAFAGVTASAEYPKYDPSWTEDVKGNYGGTMTWTGVEYPCEHTNTQTTGKTDPTCTATGYTGDTVCADCYKTISYGTTIGALGHSFADGICTACGEEKQPVQLASGTCGVSLRWIYWDTGLLEITGTGQMYNYSKTNTPWYAYRESITALTISTGATSIGNFAFSGCTGLTEVVVPDNITTISGGAFNGCSSLESITLPFIGNTVKTPTETYQYPLGYIFGTGSYTGGVSTTQYYYGSSTGYTTYVSYYIPASLKTVTVTGGYLLFGAFYNCKSIENIYVGAGVTNAQPNAFRQCAALKGIWVEEGNLNLVSDAQGALYSKDMTTLFAVPGGYEGTFVIPDSVTTIESYAFADCTKLTSVTFGSKVQTIKAYAFYNCKALEMVTLNQGLSKIETEAFYNCTSLKTLEIPSSVTSIGQGALRGCSALESLTIPFVGGSKKTPQDTYQYPFGYIFGTANFTGAASTSQQYYGSSLSSTTTATYYIPGSLKNVTVTGGYVLYSAFQNCEYLTAVTLGDDVASIGDYAFQDCAALCEISFGGADSIGKYAFSNCTSLDEIVIPATVSYVGDYAFDGASAKTAIIGRADEFGYGRSMELGKYLFTSVETVYLGEYVKTVTEATFHTGLGWYCNMLQAIHVDEDNPYYSSDEYGILFNKDKTTLICCPNRFGPSYTIPDSVTTIGYSAFENCLSLKKVTLGENVSTIESYAFYECSALQQIHIGDRVQTLGDYAFEDCTQLTTVIMGDGITTIPLGAFNNCSRLHTVAIGHNVQTIAHYAFNSCISLETVTIPASVKTLGSVFGGCTKLKEICFLGGAPTMADDLFYNVTATAYYSFAGGGWTVSVWKDYGGEISWSSTNTPCQHSQSMVHDAKTVTCTENGYTGDTLCVGCRELISAGSTVIATGHSYSISVTSPTCTEEGYSTYTCRNCDDSYVSDVRSALNHPNTQLTGVVQATCTADGYSGDTLCNTCNTIIATGQVVPAGGHSYESVVTKPTCYVPGFTTYTCAACGDSYTGDPTEPLNHADSILYDKVEPTCNTPGYTGDLYCRTCNDFVEWGHYILPLDHTYVDGTCTGCGAKDPAYVSLVEFSGMTMTLGNSLAANFVINTALLEGSDHYAVITKTYADDTQPVSVTIPQSDWKVYSGKLYYFTFTGVNAKEMTDEFTVIVYNAQDRQVSVTYTRTIEDYCYGLITKEEVKASPDPERLALYTDMLNYGAAAQDFFGYNLENLANKRITAAQQAYATQSVTTNDVRTKGTGYMGSTLSLKNEILMNFVYQNATINKASYAVYTFQHHDGGQVSVTVQASQFKAYGTSGKYIDVVGMKVADCNQVITVTLYDVSGNVLSTSTDSVWSYASRNTSKHEVYTAVLKLATSAYNYFH